MNWKREAADKLRNYEAHRQALRSIPEEIKRLESAYAGIRSATSDSTPVTGGGSAREDALLSNIVHREELARQLEEARLWVKGVNDAFGVLTDEERLVLDRLYIHRTKGGVSGLCGELGVEQSTAYRKRDSALRHFTIAMYGATETE